ncbi:WXG100 family type VII secretion target [Streptomyces sp. NRRL F-5123]|uniref:WXG100 family type VII secretion target n=1 Tax=Streptomyces sp. NRRL F-5123 TaxID=1463856 RepID=UPI00099B697E|nr:WXG100 family type VII secretion target [Streptomyces sp. NRRL F-5123]
MTIPLQPTRAEVLPNHYASSRPDPEGRPSTIVGGVNYHVTPEYLAQARTDTLKTAEAIEGQLAELKSYVQQVESAWDGIAQGTFVRLMQDYDIYARMLHDSLTDIASGLQGTYANYINSEAQNINNLHALGEDLPTPPTGTNFD